MTIEITIRGDHADEALTELKRLAAGLLAPAGGQAATPTGVGVAGDVSGLVVIPDAEPAQQAAAPAPEPAPHAVDDKPKRTRRTKAQIEADNAAAQVAPDPAPAPVAEDAPEVQAQDAADEQAEVEANRDPEKPLTREDLKNVMTEYVTAYGIQATQEDGPKIFKEALGAPPEGEAFWKLSLVPEDQAKLAQAIAVWKRAVAENPLKRAKVA